jgi:hypothetical protein
VVTSHAAVLPLAARRREAGYALLVALMVVFLVSVALSLIALSLAVRLSSARLEARGVTLSALCDAALAETLAGLAAGGAGGVSSHAFGGGQIGSQVESLGPQQFVVTATATYGGRARTVVANVVRDAQGTRVVHWQRLSG